MYVLIISFFIFQQLFVSYPVVMVAGVLVTINVNVGKGTSVQTVLFVSMFVCTGFNADFNMVETCLLVISRHHST